MLNPPIQKVAKAAVSFGLVVGLSVGTVGVASAHGRGGGLAVTDEAVVAEITDAALAEVPDGTIIKIKETKRGDAAYQVFMSDADGGRVKLYLDADYAVVDVITDDGDDGDDGDDVEVIDETIIAAASEAALAAVPGGTVVGVYEEDDDDATYEVKMTDADGNKVKVYLDAEYNVVKTKTFDKGHGRGHGRGHGKGHRR